MIIAISFNEFAEKELNESADYYEFQVKGLGITFLAEVERSIKLIQQNPESFSPVLKVVCRKILRRFPYSIMFSFVDNSIRILAIANHKRRPYYWRGRN
ncbi:MAG: hypothetical protein Q8Q47_04655 [Ignavibacteriaceae bacterium]|nr:hypothetical protein [Ignavibacteriaceae bacterium]